jgi:hypothetical protein
VSSHQRSWHGGLSVLVTRLFCVRLSDFWQRMETQFGSTYARSLARDYRVSALGGSVEDALESGVPAKDVWRAVCAEFRIDR